MKIFFKQNNKKFYIVNERIIYPNLRIINHLGKQVGIFSRQEALNLAKQNGLDLVLITPKSNPPVAKLINFKKFLYQENKKKQKAQKGIKKSLTKDIKLSLFVAQNDLERLANKAKKFIDEGNQVRILLVFRGREITKKNKAFELIESFTKLIEGASLTNPPKIQGRTLIALISRSKN